MINLHRAAIALAGRPYPPHPCAVSIDHPWLFRWQYRYPVEGRYWEIPQGSWENDAKADPQAVAAGELQEETGLVSREISYIGHLYQAYGYSNQGFHLYLATDFEKTDQKLDIEEEGLVTDSFTIEEFESMIAGGVIKDATTVSAYCLAKSKGFLAGN